MMLKKIFLIFAVSMLVANSMQGQEKKIPTKFYFQGFDVELIISTNPLTYDYQKQALIKETLTEKELRLEANAKGSAMRHKVTVYASDISQIVLINSSLVVDSRILGENFKMELSEQSTANLDINMTSLKITMKDASTLNLAGYIKNDISMDIKGESKVHLNMNINKAKFKLDNKSDINMEGGLLKNIDMKLAGSSSALMSLSGTQNVNLDLSGKSAVEMKGNISSSLSASFKGGSKAMLKVDTKNIQMEATGSSKVLMSGTAKKLKCVASGNSEVDAKVMMIEKAEVETDGSSKVEVKAKEMKTKSNIHNTYESK